MVALRIVMRTEMLRLFVALTALTLAACSKPATQPDTQPTEQVAASVHVKVLAFNDLHGHVTGPSSSVMVEGTKVEAGGADHLAARVQAIRASHSNTVVVTAGDLIGASPLLSALFHDEPTIEAMNAMKLDVAAVGNHEFDDGVDELRRMVAGGCHPVDGCLDGDGFDGADFPMLAANVTVEETGELLFDGIFVKEFEDVKVGFIGLTLEGTPAIVSPDGIRGLAFHNEVETINAAAAELQAQGIEAIVVLIHEGGAATLPLNDVNDCPGISGPINAIVEGSSDAVDVFVTGHTHQPYICDFDGTLVTAAQSYGALLTEIDLQIDPTSGDVVSKRARNLVIDRAGDPHHEVDALVKKYTDLSAPLANRPVALISADVTRDPNDDGESPLGQLIADIQLDATRAKERGGAQIAFMNPGGIRTSLTHAASGDEGDGVVTYTEAHTVQPFGNSIVTLTLTGAQLHDLLEQQWVGQDRVRLLQVSAGFTYAWSASAEDGDRVDPASIKLHGKTVDPAANYRVTVNSFLSTGGDGFTILNDGTDRIGGPLDLEAFVQYFEGRKPYTPSTERRIRKIE